ncbi:hypothetical protein SNEBB_008536 [Seison nebaliae]|nr:hypothetical protein SNEBB_008536 [Seison nebaliae]
MIDDCLQKEMLHIIGLGLGNAHDITLVGLNVIRKCDFVFIENYTSVMVSSLNEMESLYEKKIEVLYREDVESEMKYMELAKEYDVALLVIGDPFCATTHSTLLLEGKKRNIQIKTYRNASIMNCVGSTGLELYRFGETVSFCFWKESERILSYFEKIERNRSMSLHTLCLLDIKIRENDIDAMMKGQIKYLPNRFMKANEACGQLVHYIDVNVNSTLTKNTLVVAVCRLGSETERIIVSTIGRLAIMSDDDLGKELHSIVIPGRIDIVEKEVMELYKQDDLNYEELVTNHNQEIETLKST